jgi:hypothetical protein
MVESASGTEINDERAQGGDADRVSTDVSVFGEEQERLATHSTSTDTGELLERMSRSQVEDGHEGRFVPFDADGRVHGEHQMDAVQDAGRDLLDPSPSLFFLNRENDFDVPVGKPTVHGKFEGCEYAGYSGFVVSSEAVAPVCPDVARSMQDGLDRGIATGVDTVHMGGEQQIGCRIGVGRQTADEVAYCIAGRFETDGLQFVPDVVGNLGFLA